MTALPSARRLVPRSSVLALVGALLVVLLAPLPPAHAIEELEIVADATYRVMADESRLDIEVDFELTNRKPSTSSGGVTTQYYFDRFSIVVPDEAVDIVAIQHSDDTRPLILEDVVRAIDDDGTEARVVTMRFRRRIFYRGSTRITVTFGVPGGEPRSESGIRVNPAYAAFPVWAWGDPDKSTVAVEIPSDFDVTTSGDLLIRRDDGETNLLFSNSIPDPQNWGVFVNARHDDALTFGELVVNDLAVSVRAWPGDDSWSERVLDVVERGLPELQRLVGLDFGEQETLEILESLDPSLFGYAGWYLTDSDQIEMGEFLDDHVILHEIAHLWFDSSLFDERWITEGLADEYAARVVEAIDGESDDAYRRVRRPIVSRSVAVPLNEWRVPFGSPADDEETSKREDYGYNASYFVMRVIMDEIGTEGMSLVLNAALDDLIAYRGAGPPETVDPDDDWQRFLDLLEEVAGSTEAEAVFRDYVLDEDEVALVDERAEARALYAETLGAAGAWDTPWALRQPMADWDFAAAVSALKIAGNVIELRDEVADLVAAMELNVPTSVEQRFEDARSFEDLEAALELAGSHQAAAAAVAEARAAVDAPRGFFAKVGLIGENPEAAWREAADAFEGDEMERVVEESAEAVALVLGAEDIGKGRVLWASVVLFAFLLLVAVGVWLFIRHRRSEATGPIEV